MQVAKVVPATSVRYLKNELSALQIYGFSFGAEKNYMAAPLLVFAKSGSVIGGKKFWNILRVKIDGNFEKDEWKVGDSDVGNRH